MIDLLGKILCLPTVTYVDFVDQTKVIGAETLPKEGPLLIASNHPGAYDSLVISSQIPRDDLKIISSDIPFVKKLPETSKHMIFSTHDPHDRMSAARKAIRHLKDGGALLIFARATMDPSVMKRQRRKSIRVKRSKNVLWQRWGRTSK